MRQTDPRSSETIALVRSAIYRRGLQDNALRDATSEKRIPVINLGA